MVVLAMCEVGPAGRLSGWGTCSPSTGRCWAGSACRPRGQGMQAQGRGTSC